MFDATSHSTTTLGMLADNIEEIKQTIEDDGLWIYVSARLEESED